MKTWLNPILNQTTHNQKYCLITVKVISDAAFATIQIRIISLAGRWWKVGGATKLPSSRPRKTTEPKKPSYALSMLKSSLMLRVMAGKHPWSMLTRMFVKSTKMKKHRRAQGSISALYSSASSSS